MRIRGNASQVHEKYLALSRDANLAGDRVAAESYLQYAEHYFRIINADNDGEGRSQHQHQHQHGGFGRGGFGPGDEQEEEDDGLASGQRSQPRGDGGRQRDPRQNGSGGEAMRTNVDLSTQPQPAEAPQRAMPIAQPAPVAQPAAVAQPAPRTAPASVRNEEFEPELGLPAAYTAAVGPQDNPVPAPRRRGRPPGKGRVPPVGEPATEE